MLAGIDDSERNMVTMEYDEFIEEVQAQASFTSHNQAREAVRATLASLGEHISGGQAMKLAAQLPPEIRDDLQQQADSAQAFDLDEFFARISQREETNRATAEAHARAVLKTVKQSVEPSQWQDTLAQLPKEFDSLFE